MSRGLAVVEEIIILEPSRSSADRAHTNLIRFSTDKDEGDILVDVFFAVRLHATAIHMTSGISSSCTARATCSWCSFDDEGTVGGVEAALLLVSTSTSSSSSSSAMLFEMVSGF